MSSPQPQQRRLTIRGRVFHFVAYQGSAGNPQRKQPSYPAMWYLMVEGRRCQVLPCEPQLTEQSLDALLSAWVEDNAMGPVEPARLVRVGPVRPNENWWGPN